MALIAKAWVTSVDGKALHPMSADNLADVLTARLLRAGPDGQHRYRIAITNAAGQPGSCGCAGCCFSVGDDCGIPRQVESCLTAAARAGIDPIFAGYVDTQPNADDQQCPTAAELIAKSRSTVERPCCGTFRGTPHRSTCLNYREGGE